MLKIRNFSRSKRRPAGIWLRLDLRVAVDPFFDGTGLPGAKFFQQAIEIVLEKQHFTVLLEEKTIVDDALQKGTEIVVVAVDVEQTAGLLMNVELAPGEHFKHFVQGANAAGERDETIRQLGHAHLSFEHGLDDLEFGAAGVTDLKIQQRPSDDADHFATGLEAGVGDTSHQPDAAASVDKTNVLFGEALTGISCSGEIAVATAGTGTAEYAEGIDFHGRDCGGRVRGNEDSSSRDQRNGGDRGRSCGRAWTVSAVKEIPFRQLDPAAALLGLAVIIGLLLQLTVRDGISWLAAVYYALPVPLIVAFSLALSIWWKIRKKRCWCLGFLILACFLFVLWCSRNRPSAANTGSAAAEIITVGFWNAARTEHPIEPLVEWLEESNLDILAMVEAPPLSAASEREYRRTFPGWQVRSLRGGRVIFWRGGNDEHTWHQWETLPNRSSVSSSPCRLSVGEGKDIRLVVADVGPNPFYPRGEILDSVLERAGSDASTIVVGDFNTPVESVHFDKWREHFSHGATEGGIGYRETWPWFAPVLCIDHLWFSKDFSVRSARRKNFLCSDHSMVIVEVGFDPNES